VTDEHYGYRGGDDASGPRRIPIYDRRVIRPEDLTGERPPPSRPPAPGAESPQQEASVRVDEPSPDAGGYDGGPEILVDENSGGAGDPARAEPADSRPAESVDELAAAKAQAAEHLGDLQRLQADFANYRKRVLREQTELVERAAAHLVNRLLSVLDSFDLAVAAAEETKDFERMLRGVEMVLGELKEVLKAEGLEPIPAENQPFDPNLHEAALEVPGDEDGEMYVAGVLRPGYVLRGRILRPAMVKVSRRRVDAGKGEPAES
jgi:molecular chaperone GrpE